MKINNSLKAFVKEHIEKNEENQNSWSVFLKILPDDKNDTPEYYLGLYQAGKMICDWFKNDDNIAANNKMEGAKTIIEGLIDFCEIKKEINVLSRLIAIENMCNCFLKITTTDEFDQEKDLNRPLRLLREKYNQMIIHEK